SKLAVYVPAFKGTGSVKVPEEITVPFCKVNPCVTRFSFSQSTAFKGLPSTSEERPVASCSPLCIKLTCIFVQSKEEGISTCSPTKIPPANALSAIISTNFTSSLKGNQCL